jgi:hypothetical protein
LSALLAAALLSTLSRLTGLLLLLTRFRISTLLLLARLRLVLLRVLILVARILVCHASFLPWNTRPMRGQRATARLVPCRRNFAQ